MAAKRSRKTCKLYADHAILAKATCCEFTRQGLKFIGLWRRHSTHHHRSWSATLADVPSFFLTLAPRCPGRDGQPEENQDRLIEAQDILVVQPADMGTDFGLWNGGDLVHHQPGGEKQPVAFTRLHGQAEQRRVGPIGGEGADRDRVRGVEAVISILFL